MDNNQKQTIVVCAAATIVAIGALALARKSMKKSSEMRAHHTPRWRIEQVPFSLAKNYPRWAAGIKRVMRR